MKSFSIRSSCRHIVVGASLLSALLVVGACGAAPDKPACDPAASRVGVYDGRALAIAYANSDQFARWLQTVRAEHDAAKARGDTAAAAAWEAKAVAQQERLHGQAFGGDAVDDVLAQVEAELPAVLAAAGVAELQPIQQRRAAEVATVDVTDAIVELFHPDERARGWIADVRRKPLR